MPVLDGVLVPRTPLSPAELDVDWIGHYDHVTERRALVEKRATPAARRLALTVAELGTPGPAQREAVAERMEAALSATARYGFASARTEIAALRARHPVRGELVIRDPADYATAAASGLPGVLAHMRDRALHVAAMLASIALSARTDASLEPADIAEVTITQAVAKALHNHVLELVGESFNLGRAAGALTLDRPPAFALRSEQLDKATCDACTRLHGTIVEVGSPSFYEYLPPAGCYGGGRCRGVMIFADETQQARGPATVPGPQPPLSPIPPVRTPERRAA